MTNQNSSRRSFLLKSAVASTGLALLSSSQAFANLLTDQSPFKGYNQFSESSIDLRKGLLPTKGVQVKGRLYAKDGMTTVPDAKIEVWHLSPKTNKFTYKGHFFTNEEGHYSFYTDFPGKDEGKKPRIFFKASKNEVEIFTQLVLDPSGAYIMGDHWESNRQLGDKVFPVKSESSSLLKIQFNFTLY